MEPFCIWSGAFTPEDCDRIVKNGELAEFQKGAVGEQKSQDNAVRDTDIAWIMPSPNTFWIFDRMNEVVSKVNFDKYQMDLREFDGFQYSKYAEKGHYDWHVDTEPNPRPSGLFRKLSCSLALSNPEDYEGGELLLNVTGKAENSAALRPTRGDLVLFYSSVPHKVMPVTKGKRVTLVTWACGPKLV
jgi:PKHD-type hydroxylase